MSHSTPPAPPAPDTAALSVQTQAWRQQQLEWLTACTLRASTGDASLGFRGRHAWRGAQVLPWLAPHLRTETSDGLESFRSVADALALRHTASDPAVHQRHIPADELARMLYEWFEQIRCEALAPPLWQGTQHNLHAHFRRWLLRFHDSPLIDTHLGQLLFATVALVWSHIHRQPPPEAVMDAMEATRANLAPQLGQAVRQMARHHHDQARFAPAAADLACHVAALVQAEQARAAAYPANRKPRPTQGGFFLWLDASPQEGEAPLLAPTGDSRSFAISGQRYRIFSRDFDRELRPATLVRHALLLQYRNELDQRLHDLHAPTGRLGRQLAALMAVPLEQDWQSQQEAGRVNPRQLTQLITNPQNRHIFRHPARHWQSDCAITLLMDCSGSMKTHAQSLALLAELWARVAAQAQIPLEVLGFSTASWHGGQARRQWQRAGSPAHAGRVAEQLHLVIKTAQEPWQRSRLSFASLLKLDMYREGLDGEAVQWACTRLLQQDARRRVLLVVSDGCPMEAGTQQANDAYYLDNHLKAVVRQYGAQGIHIIGLGLGLDLSPFYPRYLAIEPHKLLHTSTFQATLAAMRA